MLSAQVTTAQHMEREKAYDKVSLCTLLHLSFPHSFVFGISIESICLCISKIATALKIPFLDEEVAKNSFPRKVQVKFIF